MLSDLSDSGLQAMAALVVAVGLLYCFLGYRLSRWMLALTGFALAGGVAAAALGWLTGGKLVFMAVAGMLGGITGACAMFSLYRAGVLCLGVLAGALAAQNVLAARLEDWVPSAIVAASVFGGLSALVFEQGLMILATAALGAFLVMEGALQTMPVLDSFRALRTAPEQGGIHYLLLGVWLVLTLTGASTQFGMRRTRGKRA